MFLRRPVIIKKPRRCANTDPCVCAAMLGSSLEVPKHGMRLNGDRWENCYYYEEELDEHEQDPDGCCACDSDLLSDAEKRECLKNYHSVEGSESESDIESYSGSGTESDESLLLSDGEEDYRKRTE